MIVQSSVTLRELSERVFLLDYPKTRIYSLTGADSIRYLHNRLTQDVKQLSSGTGVETLLLSPNGRIQGQFLVLKREQDILLLTDEIPEDSVSDEVKRAILQFRVSDQVELKDLSTEFAHLALIGDPVHTQAEKLGFAPATTEELGHETREIVGVQAIVIRSESPITRRFDLLVPSLSVLPLKMAAAVGGIPAAEPQFREVIRILEGRGKLGCDLLIEKTLAPEYVLDKRVSFKKGCYPGQEVVEMATARGRPNRRFVQLLCEGEWIPGREISEEGRVVGTVTSSVFLSDLGKSVALAFLKSDAGDFLSGASRTTPAELRALLIG